MNSTRTFGAAVLAAALLLPGGPAAADDGRIQAANTLLYQVGRDPANQMEDRTKLFDQVRLDYLSGAFRFGLRAETFRSSVDGPVHEEFTHKYAAWRDRGLSLRVGNAYATIGRGLLFRAYELPGVIREVTFPDSKYMDTRDLDGAVLEGRRGRLEFLALSGRPIAYPDNPPGQQDMFLFRRAGTVSGGRVGLDLGRGVELGHGYLRADGFEDFAREPREEFASVDVTVRASRLAPGLADAGWDARLYAEYAGRNWSPLSDAPSTSPSVPHALYTAVELGRGRWGLSWETKHYRDFLLPFNDPPNLVPELAPSLVNRRSHFLYAADERGHQLGVQGAVGDGWTLHLERAGSRTGRDEDPLRYRLTYLEAASPPLADTRVTVFVAEGRDDVEGLDRHRSAGVAVERSLSGGDAVQAAVEVQDIRRDPDAEVLHHDVLLSAGFSRAGLGGVTVVLELSDDPLLTDDPFTFPELETDRRSWLGVVATATLDRWHELTVFAGKRRGGTACTSGTCYLVPDFEGVELRLASRF